MYSDQGFGFRLYSPRFGLVCRNPPAMLYYAVLNPKPGDDHHPFAACCFRRLRAYVAGLFTVLSYVTGQRLWRLCNLPHFQGPSSYHKWGIPVYRLRSAES